MMRLNGIKQLMIVFVAAIVLFGGRADYIYAENIHVSARNAILMEQQSGRILFEKNAYDPHRIASITKIMTAVLAIESGKLEDNVKIKKEAVSVEGSSIYLTEGETLTLKDLVYGLMLRSGNDAAVAIADYVGGSVDGFVYLMNEKARELGMSATSFANPHGLDDHEEHYSSAYDMAQLTRYAMNNETFREIFATERYRAPKEGDEWGRSWRNKNKLQTGLYDYSTGGKTGYTKRAKRTLVSTARKNDMDLIAVTLHAPDDWNDHIAMFEYGFATYELKTLVPKGKYKQVKDEFYRGNLIIRQPVLFPLKEDELDQLTSSVTLYKPPQEDEWADGRVPVPVGKLHININDTDILDIPLFFEGDPSQSEQTLWQKMRAILLNFIGVEQYD